MAGCAEKVDLKLGINSMSRAHLLDDRPLLFPLPQRICVQDFADVKYHHVCHAQCFFARFFALILRCALFLNLRGLGLALACPSFNFRYTLYEITFAGRSKGNNGNRRRK